MFAGQTQNIHMWIFWYKQVTTFGQGVSTIWENFGGTYKMEEFNLAKNAQIFAIAEDLIQWH